MKDSSSIVRQKIVLLPETVRIHLILVFGCVLFCLSGLSLSEPQAGQQQVFCESRPGATQFCHTGVIGRARLLHQLSARACVQGVTWGYSKGGIWVSDGCSGAFALSGVRPMEIPLDPQLRQLHCESRQGKLNRCTANTRGGVKLAKRFSQARCIEGKTWGYDELGVWVHRNCSGLFVIGDETRLVDSTPTAPRQIVCESRSGRRHHCPLDVRPGVQLVRELHGKACIEGATWGYGKRGIWVDKGCRALFQIGTASATAQTRPASKAQARPAPDALAPIPEGSVVETLSCRSPGGFKRCFIPMNLAVSFEKSMDASECIEGKSWGRDRDSVWVDHGCQALFLATERGRP